jgi:hypothetical protein
LVINRNQFIIPLYISITDLDTHTSPPPPPPISSIIATPQFFSLFIFLSTQTAKNKKKTCNLKRQTEPRLSFVICMCRLEDVCVLWAMEGIMRAGGGLEATFRCLDFKFG